MNRKPKIFGFNNSIATHGDQVAAAFAEDGTFLASHVCSSEGFMRHDLGMDGRSKWKHEEYDRHYPDGWETEFVPSHNIDTHPGLQEAFRLAREKDKQKTD